MAAEATVPVRERSEEVLAFMDRVILALAQYHLRRSPLCTATSLQEVKVPVEGDVIGGATGGTA